MIELKAGIYPNISRKEYHGVEMAHIVSNSYLGRLGIVPAKAKVPQEETPALAFGQAFHSFVLEPEKFFGEYFVAENRGKQKKEDKEYWEEIKTKTAKEKLTIIKLEDYDTIKKMGEAIQLHPFASQLIKEGISEQTIIWQDEETELWCKVRPDRIPAGNKGTILDVKSTSNAALHSFQGDCVKYGYAREAAMYNEGFCKVTQSKYEDLIFAFIAVEKEEPYRTEVYTLELDFLQYGWGEFHRLLQEEYKCQKDNFYPHYQYPGAEEILKPGYVGTWEWEPLK